MNTLKEKLKNSSAGISVTFALIFLLFFYAPVELFINNADELTYDIFDLLKYVFPLFLLTCIVCCSLFIWLNNKSKWFHSLYIVIVTTIFFTTYVEGSFLSRFLPSINGSSLKWEDYSIHRIYSILLWIVALSTVLIAKNKLPKSKFMDSVKYTGIIGLIFLSLSLIMSCNKDTLRDKANFSVSYDQLLDMSDDQNFIILLLDAIDGSDFKTYLDNHPESESVFEDFTFYPDTMGTYPGTKWAVPYILSGKWFENRQSFYEYKKDAFTTSNLFDELKSRNYTLNIYETDLPQEEELIEQFCNLVQSEKSNFKHPVNFIKMQLMLTGFRYLPFDLKRFCSLTPDNIYYDTLKNTSGANTFYWNNELFLNYINSSEIVKTQKPCFKFIHLCGTHEPYDYTAEIDSNYSGTYEDSIDLCINLIDIYLNMLKESNIYDNTAVIILGDHGSSGPVYFRQNPAFFVKGIDEHHSFSTSLAPISYSDLNTCFMRLMDGCIGDQLFDAVPCDVRERRFLSPYVIDDEHIVEFFQKGYAWDEETMVESGTLFNKNSTSAT